MSVRRLNHAVLYVSDVSRSVAFYREALGLEITTEIAGHAAFLRAPGTSNDHDLGLFQVGNATQPFGSKAGRATPAAPPRPGLYHLAWEVGSLPELAETRAKLATRGALVGESDHWVSKSLYAKDPDGIEFEVMWRVPAQDWEEELRRGDMTAHGRPGPLDLDAALARWGDLVTGAAAGSPT